LCRDKTLFYEDILDSSKAILEYVNGYELESFTKDRKTYSAVIREFEIIGEATKHIINDVKEKYPEIRWRDMVDFRNILIHEYFGVNFTIVWNTIHCELPKLIKIIEKILKD